MGLEEAPLLQTRTRLQLLALGPVLQQPRRGPDAELTALARCGGQPLPSLGIILTKHSPILHICSVCARCLSSFHLRSSARTRTASLEACGTEVGRWHQGLWKEPSPQSLGGVSLHLWVSAQPGHRYLGHTGGLVTHVKDEPDQSLPRVSPHGLRVPPHRFPQQVREEADGALPHTVFLLEGRREGQLCTQQLPAHSHEGLS